MTRYSLLTCALLGALFMAGPAIGDDSITWHPNVGVQSAPDDAASTLASQGAATSGPGALRAQPGNRGSLEVAPQPGSGVEPKVREIPSTREFKRSDDYASLNRKFDPNQDQENSEPPYLGITVRYTTECYMGQEEHGLQVLNVYPGSPADKGGVRGASSATAIGSALAIASGTLINPLLRRAGVMGHDGDLIIAVDDHRVRDERDLERELRKLKPGDMMYLTIVRPLPGGAHRTMKISIKVGDLNLRLAESPQVLAMKSMDDAMAQFGTEWDPPSYDEAASDDSYAY